MPTSRTLATSLVVGVGVVLASALAGCAPTSLDAEAQDLLESLQSSPGVQSAELDYTEPVILDSGKLDIRVAMSDDATTDQAAEVVTLVYEAYSTTHVAEEGDLDVRVGDDRLHLRTFQPEAETSTVREQTAAVLTEAERGRLQVDVLADDVPSDPGVQTSTLVRLPAGSGRDDVLPTLDELEATYGDDTALGWSVRAADGAALASDDNYPSDAARQRWERLSAIEMSGAYVAVDFDEYVAGNDDLYTFVSVTVLGMDAPLSLEDPQTYRRLMRLATTQVERMQSYSAGVSYRLLLEGRNVAEVDTDLGAFGRGTGKRFAEQLALTTRIDPVS